MRKDRQGEVSERRREGNEGQEGEVRGCLLVSLAVLPHHPLLIFSSCHCTLCLLSSSIAFSHMDSYSEKRESTSPPICWPDFDSDSWERSRSQQTLTLLLYNGSGRAGVRRAAGTVFLRLSHDPLLSVTSYCSDEWSRNPRSMFSGMRPLFHSDQLIGRRDVAERTMPIWGVR